MYLPASAGSSQVSLRKLSPNLGQSIYELLHFHANSTFQPALLLAHLSVDVEFLLCGNALFLCLGTPSTPIFVFSPQQCNEETLGSHIFDLSFPKTAATNH